MTTLISFITRLKKIGVEVALTSNYPWVYLETVNGKDVQGTYYSDHKFTIFFQPGRPGEYGKFTDIPTIFKKIRETLNQ